MCVLISCVFILLVPYHKQYLIQVATFVQKCIAKISTLKILQKCADHVPVHAAFVQDTRKVMYLLITSLSLLGFVSQPSQVRGDFINPLHYVRYERTAIRLGECTLMMTNI